MWTNWVVWHNHLRRVQDADIQKHLSVTLYVYFLSSYIRFSFLQTTPGLYILSFEVNKFLAVPSRSVWCLTHTSVPCAPILDTYNLAKWKEKIYNYWNKISSVEFLRRAMANMQSLAVCRRHLLLPGVGSVTSPMSSLVLRFSD